MNIINMGMVLMTLATPQLESSIKRVNMNLTDTQAYYYAFSIRKYAVAYGIDPLIVAAVIATESGFKYQARGSMGEVGLMQLRPEFHALYIPRKERAEYLQDIDNNIAIGARYLSGLEIVFKPIYKDLRFVEHYNRGPNTKPKKFPYYKKVLSYYVLFGGRIEKTRLHPAKRKPREDRRLTGT